MREIFLIMVRLNITSFSRKEHPGWVQGRTVYTGRRISVSIKFRSPANRKENFTAKRIDNKPNNIYSRGGKRIYIYIYIYIYIHIYIHTYIYTHTQNLCKLK